MNIYRWLTQAVAAIPVIVPGLIVTPAIAALNATPRTILTSGNIGATVGDVNGDGFGDIAVADPYNDEAGLDHGKVWIHLGGPYEVSPTPWWSTSGTGGGQNPDNWRVGSELVGGDFNGDSYGDLCVVTGGYANGTGVDWCILYYGSPNGMSLGPLWYPPVGFPQEFTSVTNPGDADLDGRDDLVAASQLNEAVYLRHSAGQVHTYNAACSRVAPAGDINGDGFVELLTFPTSGGISVWQGQEDGFAPYDCWTFQNCRTAAMIGDVTGDDIADILVDTPSEARIYAGGPDLFNLQWVRTIPNAGWANPVTFTAGDIDGNGLADLVISDPTYGVSGFTCGRVWVYQAYFNHLDIVQDITGQSGEGLGGIGVASAGDVNGDGFGDLLIPTLTSVKIHLGSSLLLYGQQNPQFQYFGPYTQQAGAAVATAGDVNGDGFSDLLVGSPADQNGFGGVVQCFYGGKQNTTTTPDWESYFWTPGASHGQSVASAGDVNGDGYSDVIIGTPRYSNGQVEEGGAYVYYGHASGLSYYHDWFHESNQAHSQFGWSVASAGDVNGDGFSDVIIGEPGYSNDAGYPDKGRASLFLGSPSGLASTPAWTVADSYELARLGASVASAGDVNGDGFSDVIVGAPTDWHSTPWAGRTYVYFGSASGLSQTESWSAEGGQQYEYYGSCVANGGDVNGDGYSDVLISSPGWDHFADWDVGIVYLYAGGPGGPGPLPDRFVTGSLANAHFGASVACAGDLNGDGYSDIVIGSPDRPYGGADVYMGGADAYPVPVWNRQSTADVASRWGASVACAGDLNGDGFDEIVVGAPGYASNRGLTEVFFGNYETTAFWWSKPLLPRQQRSTGALLELLAKSESNSGFDLAMNGRSPGGRTKVRLEWNCATQGTQFDSTDVGHGGWFDTGESGPQGSMVPLEAQTTGLTPGLPIHWRARVGTRSIYFPHSPWFTMATQVPTIGTVRLAENPADVTVGDPAIAQEDGLLVSVNPLRQATKLMFHLSSSGAINLSIHDLEGRLVRRLLGGAMNAGDHEASWDGKDEASRDVANGIYFATLMSSGRSSSAKLTVLR